MTPRGSAPNYFYILPPSFTGLTNVEDFLTQFEVVSTLSHCVTLTPDPRPHCFSARLTAEALTFYRSLTTAQKRSYEKHKRLFWQQYEPNSDVLKAQVKRFRQLPGQYVSVFYWKLLHLAGKAYTDDAICAISSSSPHSSKGWPIPSFGGKFENLTQQ